MARRGNGKKRIRRRQTGIKLLNLAESYVQANIVTQPLFGTSPIGFIFGDTGPSFQVSGGGFSLVEMVKRPEALLGEVGKRLMNPQTVLEIGLKSAVTNITFRFGRRFLRKSIQNINKGLMAPIFGNGAQGVRL